MYLSPCSFTVLECIQSLDSTDNGEGVYNHVFLDALNILPGRIVIVLMLATIIRLTFTYTFGLIIEIKT